MKGLDKKSNKDLQDLKQQLSQDYELVRKILIEKHTHWMNIEKAYKAVQDELGKRGIY